MKISYLFIGAALLAAITGVGCAYDAGTKASRVQTIPAQTSSPPQPVTSPEARRIVKEGGWGIPGLAQSQETKARSPLVSAADKSAQVYWTWFQPKVPAGENFLIEDAYFSAEERKTLLLSPGPQVVMKITRYDVNGKAFCYLLTIHPKDVGAISGLVYYDEDGDGKFETVERGSPLLSFSPRVPHWTQQNN